MGAQKSNKMIIIQVHSRHRFAGGEDVMFDTINRVLKERGHDISMFERKSQDINGLLMKTWAFMNSIYSRSDKKDMTSLISSKRPSIVHVHNIYPMISPSIFIACRESGVPVVMRCPDYRLTCPTYWHFNEERICERCKNGREYWCILKNCRKNIYESFAYSLRTAVARRFRYYKNNVSIFIPPSEYVKNRLIEAGIRAERIIVVPNMSSLAYSMVDTDNASYIAYVGRISSEKGISTLLTGARIAGLPIRIAGDYSSMPEILKTAPTSVQFVGHLIRDQLGAFYGNARFSVVPSVCNEAFGIVVAEAMSHGLPVIASRIGAIPEIVEDGRTGLLFEPGNAYDLAEKMKLLWNNPELCRQMGRAGKEKVLREYSENVYYERLMGVYMKAMTINKPCVNKTKLTESYPI